MKLRPLLLRIMLVSLGLAALAGVLAVITAGGDTIWRIVFTAFTTAVAVAIMIPFSLAIDKESQRIGGYAGLAWTLGAFFLCLFLTWFHSYGRVWESVGLTLLFWVVALLPAVSFLMNINRPQLRIAASVGVILSLIIFILLLAATWVPHGSSFFDFNDRLGATAGLLAVFGFLIVLNLVNVGLDRRFFRWIGIGAALAAFILCVLGVWNEYHENPLARQLVTAAASLAALLGMANVALLVPLVGMQYLVRIGTLVAAGVCTLAINLIMAQDSASSVVERLAAGSGIVTCCGILALAIFARLNRRIEPKFTDASSPITDIAITCPRCSTKQKIKLNGDACSHCRIRIEIKVEEPRCPNCSYLLYGLTSPRCPECGTVIAGAPAPAS